MYTTLLMEIIMDSYSQNQQEEIEKMCKITITGKSENADLKIQFANLKIKF